MQNFHLYYNPNPAERNARLNFETQPTISDFTYHRAIYADAPEEPLRRFRYDASWAIALAGLNNGVGRHRCWDFGEVPSSPSEKIPYVIIGPVDVSADSFSLGAMEWYCKRLKEVVPDTRINLASYYDLEKGQNVAYDPQAFDAKLGINTIYPDQSKNGWVGPSAQDMYDNLLCETIRVKYVGERDTSVQAEKALAHAQQEAAETITHISQLFDQNKLWHRAPTDGTVMLSTPPGWLVSQTKTNKTDITAKDFSLLLDADPVQRPTGKDRIAYAGTRLPSSDSPELLRVVELLGKDGRPPKLIAHFHHQTLTRGGKFLDNLTDEEIEYGRARSGDQIYGELQSKNTNWLILKNHGILWLGESAEEFESFLKNTLKLS